MLIVAAAGIPFLAAGYGADPDAWLVAQAASHLWHTGQYSASRLPGYPLHEIVSAPLVALGGCVAANAGTLAAALFLTVMWYRLSRAWGAHPALLFFSLICAPIILMNAATTMDYVWSLAFILAALDSARNRHTILAGVCIGIAGGFRPSNLTVVVPLFLYVEGTEGRRATIKLLAVSVLTTLVATLPIMMTYEGPVRWFSITRDIMSDVHPAPNARVLDFLYRTIYALGPLATLAILIALWKGNRQLRESARAKDPLVVASLAAVGILLIQFFALPLERAYLLPAIPFLLFLVDRVSSARQSLVVLLCIVSMNLVNPDITVHASNRPAFSPALREGRIAESWQERQAMMALQQKLHNASP